MKSTLNLALMFIASTTLAQKVEHIIKEKHVKRIISSLSANDMRGRSAMVPADIDRAAEFIAGEFRKLRLDFLPGEADYFQRFERTLIRQVDITVRANGEKVDPGNVVLISDEEHIHLDQQTPVKLMGPGESLFGVYRRVTPGPDNNIVLVPRSEEGSFRRLAERMKRAPRIQGPEQMGSTLFILGIDSLSQLEAAATQIKSTITMKNVVGMIRGEESPDELVVFSGHYDHIGILPPVDGDSIANGADDDASGTTAVIELSRYFKKSGHPARTLIFTAFTAEEIGGYGSAYFSEQLDPNRVVAMFNIEMIGKPSRWGRNSAFITGFERSDFGTILQKNLEGTPFTFYPDPYVDQNLFYRSDNATLARLGVPAHSISTDQIDNDPDYHRVTDEVSTLDLGNITLAIKAIAMSAESIVAGADTPTRLEIAPGR